MRISDWSSDVCSSDLKQDKQQVGHAPVGDVKAYRVSQADEGGAGLFQVFDAAVGYGHMVAQRCRAQPFAGDKAMKNSSSGRSEEHTSELQSLMRISYAVFCLKKKTKHKKYYLTSIDIRIKKPQT